MELGVKLRSKAYVLNHYNLLPIILLFKSTYEKGKKKALMVLLPQSCLYEISVTQMCF